MTYLTGLTRSVFRQSDRPLPQARPEPMLGARDRDGIRPRLAAQDCVEGRVVDLGEFRRRTDRPVPDGTGQVEDVAAHALVHRVGDSLAGPVFADLDRPQSHSPTHSPTVPTNDGPPCQHPTLVAAWCYRNRSYDYHARERVAVDAKHYLPIKMPRSDWEKIAPFVREVVVETQAHYCGRYDTKDMMGAVADLARWAVAVACLPLERGVIFHRETVADYASDACRHMTGNTAATRRSMLLRVAEAVLPPEERVAPLPPLNRDAPRVPYSEFEQRAFRSWAQGQTTATRRLDCQVILALGLGAGLATPDLLSLKVGDLQIDHLGVLVHVNRPGFSRDIPVLAAWEDALVDVVAERSPEQFVIGAQRQNAENKNYVNSFLARTQPEGRLRPDVSRLRNTWLVHHMTAGTALGPLAIAAGLETFRSLERLLRFVPAPTQDEVRRSMRRALWSVD